MKLRYRCGVVILLWLACVAKFGHAQGSVLPPGESYGYGEDYWEERFLKWYYDVWLPKYETAVRAAWQKYCQAWNEEMARGIIRLNNQPQCPGVTPINGVLLRTEPDLSVPGRFGDMMIRHFYNSKIWSADSDSVADSAATFKTYEKELGSGWSLHFGRMYYETNSGWVYENSSGARHGIIGK